MNTLKDQIIIRLVIKQNILGLICSYTMFCFLNLYSPLWLNNKEQPEIVLFTQSIIASFKLRTTWK